MEATTKKRKATALDMEAATKMTNIFDLSLDVILYIFRFLHVEDKIAFAFSCERFRRICMDGRVFRKVDLRTHTAVKTGAVSKFLRDREMAKQIRELNVSNLRFFNWQIDDHLQEFITLICPHLEALHVLNCGMSFQTLHLTLNQAPRLTSLSWSLIEFTSEDIDFLVNSIESSDEISLKNIRRLHLEIFPSESHIQIVKCLLLLCCKDIEELEIYIWQVCDWDCLDVPSFHLPADRMNPSTCIEDKLQNLHSLTVVELGTPSQYPYVEYREEFCDFISSVVRKKSQETKWRKLLISTRRGIRNLQDLILEILPPELRSVKKIAGYKADYFKTWFQKIDDNTVRSLRLCQLPSQSQAILELYKPISMVGGHAVKFLRLPVSHQHEIHVETNVFLHTLFSNFSNIAELYLLYCDFQKDIWEPLSKLQHVKKVQLMQCAISSKHCKNTQVEISKSHVLTFVQNCKNITHLDVRGCHNDYHEQFSCCLTDADLQALANLTNLESLTLYKISGIRDGTFLNSISENCKFLTTLRIAFLSRIHTDQSCIWKCLESARFLKHLGLSALLMDLESERFWNLLSHANNLERLCITSYDEGWINVPVAVETLASLPRLQVLHLHSFLKQNVELFHDQVKRMLQREESDVSTCFEFVTEQHCIDVPWDRRLIFKKALPINKVELCDMTPILEIPKF